MGFQENIGSPCEVQYEDMPGAGYKLIVYRYSNCTPRIFEAQGYERKEVTPKHRGGNNADISPEEQERN